MANYPSQEFLFQRIKELLPPHIAVVDSVAEILHISSDSAYRRIRGETPIVLDEARELCNYFKLSLDHILNVQGGSTLFQNVRVNTQTYTYEQYLKELLKQMIYISSFIHKEIVYRTKDMPIFHNFYYEPLLAFRYFFWMKTIIQHPDFSGKDFTMNCVSKQIIELSQELSRLYNSVPSTEIWNTECVNAAISQIEFYKDSGYFSSASDIKLVYESLEATFLHLKNQVEYGSKFMPDESREMKKNNLTFFFNRVLLGDNTIMVETDNTKTVFLNYDGLNYIFTRDQAFCNYCHGDLRNLMKRSTIISETSEKQRNIFFGIMLNKINERKKNL
ncbi:hypothetical protein [Terrimonas pollutisoli]|uniref:hypothetical protein n=1 Tax=Terrimonas pollutisoli TaxID=3034147 RepID=UPI0023EDFF32|nr:hypothetical protein [Terrimonas sp. H1YJ31]